MKLKFLITLVLSSFFYMLAFSRIKELYTIKKDKTIFLGFLIILYSALNFILLGITFGHYDFFMKQVMFFVIYITILSYPKTMLCESYKFNKYFILIILVLLILSFIYGKKFEYGQEERLSGLFTNPNNLALMGLSILFFIDADKDSNFKIAFIHLIILLSLYFSATSGAIIAYFAGILFKFRRAISKQILIFLIVGMFFLILNIFFNNILIEKLTKQFYMLLDLIKGEIDIKNLNFSELVTEYASMGLSVLWRLNHWYNLIEKYWNANYINKIFGFGLGSSKDLMGNMPHNEYIGFIFEQGLVGFLLIILFYWFIFVRLKDEKKYVLIIFAIYAFSENIVTNMIFMSLLALFCATNQKRLYNDEKNFKN